MAVLSSESLNLDRLLKASGETVFSQGQLYYRGGRVEIIRLEEQSAACTVRGHRNHQVDLIIVGSYLQFRCTCSNGSRGIFCEHDVAAALALHEYLQHHQPPRWKNQLTQVIQGPQTTTRQSSQRPYFLFFSLQKYAFSPLSEGWKIRPYQLTLAGLPKELRPGDGPVDLGLLEKYLEEASGLGAQLKNPYQQLQPSACQNASLEGVVFANFLVERERGLYYGSNFPLDDYLGILGNTGSWLFLGTEEAPLQKRLTVMPNGGQLEVQVIRAEEGLDLCSRLIVGEQEIALEGQTGELISPNPAWVLVDRWLVKIDNSSQADFLPSWLEAPKVHIPARDESEFLDKFYLPLARRVPLQGNEIVWEIVQGDPVCRLYLSDASDGLQAQLRFGYNGYEVIYDPQLPSESLVRKTGSWNLVRIIRNTETEEAVAKSLSSNTFGLKRAPFTAQLGMFKLRARLHPVDFLLHNVPNLTKAGFEIYGEEQLKTARVNRNKPTLAFNVSSGIDWFDVKAAVNFGDLEVSFKDIRKVLRKKERYVKLADGTIGEIPEDWIEKYKHLFALGEETADGVRLSHTHLSLIDQVLGEADRAKTDPEFERRRQHLRNFEGIAQHPIPAHFQGDLRPYQKAGFDWLHFLTEFNFGGCLADDMGLGKTIQVLAFFQSLYSDPQEKKPASLVIVPRSLLVNWQREAARFTPSLRILEYFDQDRLREVEAFNNYDLIITTYGIMLRDIELLQTYHFHHILLDESQAIKNPLSLTARAARLLKASHRLALTGTPVENSTMELWSQFAFLNPGLLGNMEYFKETFANPIEKKSDENSAQFLRKMVYPFILRRTKSQVAPELPPRSERVLYCDMDPAQRKLYIRYRDYYRGMLLGLIETDGINNARLKILEGLLRLRQISNHPHLVDDKYRGESGKFELLMETLETLRAEGHKALVFSQFVSMLRLVRSGLDERELPYLYLDGHTQNRQERVDTFQSDPNYPFFLISLKAGGLGLNLTAADYVIHIDPWWNPAVEMQATDRTHRIGQDKPVFVYKLITKDSVEEKILKLQERKRDLVDQIIATEGTFFKALTPEDVEILFS